MHGPMYIKVIKQCKKQHYSRLIAKSNDKKTRNIIKKGDRKNIQNRIEQNRTDALFLQAIKIKGSRKCGQCLT